MGLAAATSLGYDFSKLRTKRLRRMNFLLHSQHNTVSSSHFYLPVLHSAEAACRKAGIYPSFMAGLAMDWSTIFAARRRTASIAPASSSMRFSPRCARWASRSSPSPARCQLTVWAQSATRLMRSVARWWKRAACSSYGVELFVLLVQRPANA
ncbi:MAG TPA: hypothetical protein VFS02_25720 [Telluria sp.]|nr:hypothetical protein [Telluria sp.]